MLDAGDLLCIEVVLVTLVRERDQHLTDTILLVLRQGAQASDGLFKQFRHPSHHITGRAHPLPLR